MKGILIILTLALAGFFGFRAGFGGQSVSWHQRLTVIVATPAGEVRGAAVTQVTNTDTTGGIFLPPEARRVNSNLMGEAVVVEVTPGHFLFALLNGRADGKGKVEYLAYPAFGLDKATDANGLRSYAAAMAKLRAQPLDTRRTIPPKDYPLMVTFDDITKPETVREVDPLDLAAVFGPGVSLKAVTLEVTEEAVTLGSMSGILRIGFFQSWAKRHNEALKIGSQAPYFSTLMPRLAPENFVRQN